MNIAQLIEHPENLNKETLYELRNLLALYPYYQSARLLLLKNLYLLHDSSFNDELKRATIYITERQKLFNLIEANHYQLRAETPKAEAQPQASDSATDRTASLIDNFLNQIPADDTPEEQPSTSARKPTAADATIDYVAYLLESESEETDEAPTPQLKGQELIDDFINNEDGKISLQEEAEYEPEDVAEDRTDAGYFTETLARIYIKQGRYTKALEIIKRLNLEYPKKNRYFADQIRFLEKLIVNNNS